MPIIDPFEPPPSPGVVAPSVLIYSPTDDAADVALGSSVVITFSEAIVRGAGSIILKTAAGAVVETYDAASSSRLSISGATLTIDPSANFSSGTAYLVDLPAGVVKDVDGNIYAGSTSYNFMTVSESMRVGTAGADRLVGTDMADSLSGLGGDDVLAGLGAGDALDGGDGVDTAVYSNSFGSFQISRTDSGHFSISGTEGVDTLSGVERLQFADRKIALDLAPEGNAGKALEFIGTLAYPLVGEPGMVGMILSLFDQGMDMHGVCQLAIDIGLTRDLAGSDSNIDLARLAFRNVTGVEASAETAAALAGLIQGSGGAMTQADFLSMAAQLEQNQLHIDLVGLQTTGVEYSLTVSESMRVGTAGADRLVGTDMADSLSGLGGDDILAGLGGGDALDGGDGIDTAVYSNSCGDFQINRTDSGHFSISSTEGVDTLSGVERLQFADRKIALDLAPDGNAAKALEFIGTLAYPLVGEPGMVGTILSLFDQGMDMHGVCQLAIDIGLTRDLAGSDSNIDLARLAFRNVTGVEASAETAAALAGLIQGSGGAMTQADFLSMAAQLEQNQLHIDLVGLQTTGVEYS